MSQKHFYVLLFLLLSRVALIAQDACPVPDSLYHTQLTREGVVIGWRFSPGFVTWEIQVISGDGPNRDSFVLTSTVPRVSLGPDKMRYGSRYQCAVRRICLSSISEWSNPLIFNLIDCSAQPPLQCGETHLLTFPVGIGYSVPIYNCSNPNIPDGTENILNFNINQSGEDRYLVFQSVNFLDRFRVFGRRVDTSALKDCPDAVGPAWECLSDSLVGQTLALHHLQAGDYQLWIKREHSNELDALKIQYFCTYTCEIPRQTRTIIEGRDVYLDWEAGPWLFELALREAGSSTVKTRIVTGPAYIYNYQFFIPASNTIYEWRVRRLCGTDTTETTDWSVWNRFKTNLYQEQRILDCSVAAFSSVAEVHQPYAFWNNCTKTTGYGNKQTFSMSGVFAGEYRILVKNKQNRPFKLGYYVDFLNGDYQESCVNDSIILLNLTRGGSLYVYCIMEDTLPADYTMKIVCPCPPSLVNASAFLRSDNTTYGYVNWLAPGGFSVDSIEVELQPLNAPFKNIPNASGAYIQWDTLNYQKDYYCRMRPICEPPALWSDTVDFFPIFDCNRVRKLACSQPLLLFLGKGFGPDNHLLENTVCLGHERYATFKASTSGFYEFRILRRNGNARAFTGLIYGCTNTIGAYLATGTDKTPLRVFLMNGQTYTLVLDKPETDTRGEFEVTVECTPVRFDRPYDSQGQLTAQELPFVTSCAPYSNVNATTDFTDPLPTAPNGNWKDGPEHTVWFWLEAPFNGIVHISVKGSGPDPIDPQIALVRDDSLGFFPNPVLASAEDWGGTLEASLSYTGLTPGKRYLLMVDGAGAKTGTFCISYDTELPLLNTLDTCETFTRNYQPSAQPDRWVNLYGARTAFEDGPLLAALQTSEDLGPISISVKRTTDAPILANGLKLLPRYFNINTARQPQFPVKLRLFYTESEYQQFRFTPPFPTDTVPKLTFYDGINEDCNPFNNGAAPALSTQPSNLVWVWGRGFYIEGTVTHFSEFSAGGRLTSRTTESNPLSSWRVYPNPAREGLWLTGELATSTDLQATLLHPTGVPVWQQQWSSSSGKQQQYIPVETLPAGTYQLLLQVAQTGESVVLKVFVH